MMRKLLIFCLGTGITLLLAGLMPFIVNAQDEEEPTPVPIVEEVEETETPVEEVVQEVSGNNGFCVVCHNQPWQAVTLRDGTILNLYVNPDMLLNSVHGRTNPEGPLGCVDCHGENVFPHNGPTPDDSRSYALSSVNMCQDCHETEFEDLANGLHEQAIAAGNTKAAVCTDCHGSHDIQPASAHPELVAGVCGDCHISTLTEWRASPHVDIGPLGCATCHSPHSQELRVGEDEDGLCINCHSQPETIYIHEIHQTDSYEVTCSDCHMFVNPDTDSHNVELMPTGHTMELDTRPCNVCHEVLEDSGEWETIRAAETVALDEPEVEEHTEEDTSNDDLIRTIQGLIVGLGMGVTLAVVFIPRFNRGFEAEEEETEEQIHE